MKKLFGLRALLALLGLAGIVAYVFAPSRERHDILVPGKLVHSEYYVYNDSAAGGTSRALLAHYDSLLIFDYSLGANKGAYCGFGWEFGKKRRNWSFMDSLILDIRAIGTDQVIVKIISHDPDVTVAGKDNTLRPVIKEVAVSKDWQRIAIPVEDLYVPDYWYNDNGVSKNYDSKHLESVVRVEFTPGWESARGKPLSLQVRGLEVHGASNLYFGILVFWLLLLIIVAMGVRTGPRD